jgi:hypothetical protein
MKFIKTTALLSLFVSFIMISCEKEAEVKKTKVYSKNGIIMSGAQEVPANASTGTGTIDVTYDKRTQILNYTIKFSGLTGPATAAHIHGLAPVGYSAPVVQPFSGFPAATSGTYSGSLLADGVLIKEEDILNGLYYANIHTTANPGGEIKGQIKFQ